MSNQEQRPRTILLMFIFFCVIAGVNYRHYNKLSICNPHPQLCADTPDPTHTYTK